MQQLNLVLVAFGVIGGSAWGFYLGYSNYGLLVAICGMVIGAAGGASALVWRASTTTDATGSPKP